MTINPPEGEFTVMNYRVAGDFHVPFRVFPFVEEMSQDKLSLLSKFVPTWSKKTMARTSSFALPCQNRRAVSTVLDKSAGEQTCEYSDKRKDVVWKIKSLPEGRSKRSYAKLGLCNQAAPTYERKLGRSAWNLKYRCTTPPDYK